MISDGSKHNTNALLARIEALENEVELLRASALSTPAPAQTPLKPADCQAAEDPSAEQALVVAQARLELALAASGLGIYDWDMRNDTGTVSAAWVRAYGLPEGTTHLDHAGWRQTLHPDDRDEVAERALVYARSPNTSRHEFRVVWADGTIHWVESTGKTLFDEQGQPVRLLGTAADITARKHAEEALRESEQRFRAAIDHFPHGILIYGRDRTIQYVNDWNLRLFRLPAESLLGKQKHEVYPHELAGPYRTWLELAWLELVWQTKTTQSCEITAPEQLGGITAAVTWVPLLDAQGEISQVLAITWDITERKRSEAALRNSEQRRQLAMRAASLRAFEWDIVNDSVTSDVTGERLTFDGVLGLIHPEDRTAFEAGVRRAMALPDLPYHSEYRVLNPEGETLWFQEWGQFTCDAARRPVHLAGVAQNITAQRLAAQALEAGERRLKTLVESIPGIVFMTDAEGLDVYTNRTFQQYCGLESEHLLGEGWLAVVHPDDVSATMARWLECVHDGTNFEFEYRLRRYDGAWRWHIVRGTPMPSVTGEPELWLGICTDIEGQKRTETDLRRSNEDLQQFAYVASHDLQEPLRTVSAFSTLLSRKYHNQLDADAHRLISYTVDAASRMSRLIQDLLDYSRLTREGEDVNLPVDLNITLRSVVAQLRSQIEEKGAEIDVPSLPTLIGDPSQYLQLFQNLLSNSLKYAHPDRNPRIQIATEDRGTSCHITVSDNGLGFSPRHSERIFGIFKRLHGNDVPGTGIGLAIVKTIVERRGGRIWAESTPGCGATFHITLPAPFAQVNAPSNLKRKAVPEAGMDPESGTTHNSAR